MNSSFYFQLVGLYILLFYKWKIIFIRLEWMFILKLIPRITLKRGWLWFSTCNTWSLRMVNLPMIKYPRVQRIFIKLVSEKTGSIMLLNSFLLKSLRSRKTTTISQPILPHPLHFTSAKMGTKTTWRRLIECTQKRSKHN